VRRFLRCIVFGSALLLVGCAGQPGPSCRRFIRTFEETCKQENAPARLCGPAFANQIRQLKRAASSAEAEDICRANAATFAEMRQARSIPLLPSPE
jgi:hypothetical protein